MLRSHSSADWIWRSPTSPQPSHFRGVLPASPCATAIFFHAGRFGFWVGALGLNFAPALVFFGWRAFRADGPVAVVARLTLTSHAGRAFFRSSYLEVCGHHIAVAVHARARTARWRVSRAQSLLWHSRCDTRAVASARIVFLFRAFALRGARLSRVAVACRFRACRHLCASSSEDCTLALAP